MEHNINKQLAHQTPLFQATYKLYISWHLRCEKIPKKDRFTIGQKIENILLEVLTLVTIIYHTKDPFLKKENLRKANAHLECLKIIFRLAKDVRTLDQERYIYYETKLQEIGKMMGGWMRQQTQNSLLK